MMAKRIVPTNPVTQLPPTSEVIGADLFNRIVDLVFQEGEKEEDGKGYKLCVEAQSVSVPAEIGGTMPGFCTFGKESCIARVYFCAGLGSFKDAEWETLLELNLRAVLSGMCSGEFAEEMTTEIKVECDHLPTEKTHEILFKVRDEIGVENIAKLFGYKGGVQ